MCMKGEVVAMAGGSFSELLYRVRGDCLVDIGAD